MTQVSVRANALLVFAQCALACIATDADQRDLPVCVTNSPSADISEAVVRLNVDAPGLSSFCNALAIAPSLLLTQTTCVAVPAAEYDFTLPRCQFGTGSPIEDGSLEYRYSALADPDSITLQHEDGSYIDSRVVRLFASEPASTCMPDLSILRIQPELHVPTLPLRLEGNEQLGEEVAVMGFDIADDDTRLRTSDATIEELTTDVGNEDLPPRSLRLSGSACTLEGGAVLARETSALIAMIATSELTIDCQAEQASPLALQLAPSRRFLLETASEARAQLVLERPVGSRQEGLIPNCPETNTVP